MNGVGVGHVTALARLVSYLSGGDTYGAVAGLRLGAATSVQYEELIETKDQAGAGER
jgi:hypothetical protein